MTNETERSQKHMAFVGVLKLSRNVKTHRMKDGDGLNASVLLTAQYEATKLHTTQFPEIKMDMSNINI